MRKSSYWMRLLAILLIALMLFVALETLFTEHHCSDLLCPFCGLFRQKRFVPPAVPLLIFGLLLFLGWAKDRAPAVSLLSDTLVDEKVKITS